MVVVVIGLLIIQNTQKRNDRAVQLRLDERAQDLREARTGLMGLEDLFDQQFAQLEGDFQVVGDW